MNGFLIAGSIFLGLFLLSTIVVAIVGIITDPWDDNTALIVSFVIGMVSVLASGVLFLIGVFQYNINTCPNCETTTFSKYCEDCGNYIDRTCPQCEVRLSNDNENFCGNCGTEINKE